MKVISWIKLNLYALVVIVSAMTFGFVTAVLILVPDWSGQAHMAPGPVGTMAPSVSASPGYTIPTGQPSSRLPNVEDAPGWDCRVQGNHVCWWSGERWLSLDHLSGDPYTDCMVLLDAGSVGPDGVRFASSDICEPLAGQRG